MCISNGKHTKLDIGSQGEKPNVSNLGDFLAFKSGEGLHALTVRLLRSLLKVIVTSVWNGRFNIFQIHYIYLTRAIFHFSYLMLTIGVTNNRYSHQTNSNEYISLWDVVELTWSTWATSYPCIPFPPCFISSRGHFHVRFFTLFYFM